MSDQELENVSRETMERLQAFQALVIKWNKTINLVSRSSIPDLWGRHVVDSAQVGLLCQGGRTWVDIGSGGGFPGLVSAIISLQTAPERKTVLIESDVRKATFLRTAIRELALNAVVLADRIEKAEPQNADVLSARALADLDQLLNYAQRHLASDGVALFMKGTTWEKELETASRSWSFGVRVHKSTTNPEAAILEMKDIKRA